MQLDFFVRSMLVEYQPSRKSICLSRPGAVVISYLVQLPRDDRSRRLKRKTSIIPTLQGCTLIFNNRFLVFKPPLRSIRFALLSLCAL
ncbi:hypothetical protein D917_03251 [Trichinella nativa]|uniref:Uncharacterized protein n=1 Tax=Trichinella nativa TaxID=6335 RepID=A0A1Y3E9A6_9BILA|nr:hypothetical protein D917_03251 [Trichinella nativa]